MTVYTDGQGWTTSKAAKARGAGAVRKAIYSVATLLSAALLIHFGEAGTAMVMFWTSGAMAMAAANDLEACLDRSLADVKAENAYRRLGAGPGASDLAA